MAVITVSNRSGLFPVGTSVGLYPAGSLPSGSGRPPGAAAIVSATVDAAGVLTFNDPLVVAGVPYVASAAIAGFPALRVTASDSVAAQGRATGVGDTSSGSNTLLNVTTVTGAWVVGQRVTGPGIPAGTFVQGVSGSTLTLSDKATATATGVALEGHRGGTWRAQVMRRRAAIGTS